MGFTFVEPGDTALPEQINQYTDIVGGTGRTLMTDTKAPIYRCPRSGCDWVEKTERGMRMHLNARHGPLPGGEMEKEITPTTTLEGRA